MSDSSNGLDSGSQHGSADVVAERSDKAVDFIEWWTSPEFEECLETLQTTHRKRDGESEEDFEKRMLTAFEAEEEREREIFDFLVRKASETPLEQGRGKQDAPEPEACNDAELIDADFTDDFLDREIEISMTRKGARAYEWPSDKITVEKFIESLSRHKVGHKDGPAILQGKAISGQRKANSMKFLDILILDIDTGQPIDDLVNRIRELGLAAVVYSSHSHLKNISDVGKDALMKWAETDSPSKIMDSTMRAFLIDEKGYEPSVLEEIEYRGVKHTKEGVVCRIKHAPMPKFKVVLFLKRRYVIAEEAATQKDAIIKWKELYAGTAHLLGAHYDKSCVDPSRLQYTPRRPNADAPFVLKIIGGEPLDLGTIERKSVLGKKKRDPFEEAGRRAAGQEFATPGMKKFLAQYAHVFEAADFFMAHDPDGVRAEVPLGLDVRCPNDDMHTNAGDETDRACLVTNGTENEREPGFIWKCQHASCQEHDRAKMLDLFLQQHELTIEDCKEHCAEILDGCSYDELKERIAKITNKSDYINDVKPTIIDIYGSDLPKDEKSSLLNCLKDEFGSRKLIDEGWREIRGQREQEEAERASAKFYTDCAQQNKPGILIQDDDHDDNVEKAWKALELYNGDDPKVFLTAEGFGRRRKDQEGRLVIETLTKDSMLNVMGHAASWRNSVGSHANTSPHLPIITHVLNEDKPPIKFPKLFGIISTPVFDADGKLMDQSGHYDNCGLYLDLDPDLKLQPIPPKPTREEVKAAVSLIYNDVLEGFNFEDHADEDAEKNEDGLNESECRMLYGEASRANALATLLLPFCRNMIEGPTPLHLITKTIPRAGGGKFANVHSIIFTGKKATVTTEPGGSEEYRKQITACVKEGRQVFVLDNIEEMLTSRDFVAALTAPYWEGRQLGGSAMIKGPIRWQWIAIGNNPTTSHQMAERCVQIRIAPRVAHPSQRTDFKHPDLEKWIENNRAAIVHALLTLVRNWIAKGSARSGKRMGGFEDWVATIGGILEAADVKGFLDNRDDLMTETNLESSNISGLLESWIEKFGHELVSTGPGYEQGTLLHMIEEYDLDLGIELDGTDRANVRRLNSELRSYRGRFFDVTTLVQKKGSLGGTFEDKTVRVKIVRMKDKHDRKVQFRLKKSD